MDSCELGLRMKFECQGYKNYNDHYPDGVFLYLLEDNRFGFELATVPWEDQDLCYVSFIYLKQEKDTPTELPKNWIPA
jgi:hypothetical protein